MSDTLIPNTLIKKLAHSILMAKLPLKVKRDIAELYMTMHEADGGLKPYRYYADVFDVPAGTAYKWWTSRRKQKGSTKGSKKEAPGTNINNDLSDTEEAKRKHESKQKVGSRRKSTPLELTDELRAEGLKLGLDNIEIEYQFERMTNWFLDKKKKRPVNRTAWTNWITSPYFAPMPDHVRQARKPKPAQRNIAVPEDRSQYMTPAEAKEAFAKIKERL